MTFSQCGLRANKKSAIFVANRFHATIKFTCEMSSERAVFLDTEIFKGPCSVSYKILDVQTHFKATETFQYTFPQREKGFH